MPSPKTLEQHMKECQSIAQEKGINIIGIVEPFTGSKTKMINKCNLHGEWRTTSFDKFKQGRGCPQCGMLAVTKPLQEHLEECKLVANSKNICIEGIVGKFRGNATKLKLRCEKDGCTWETTNIDSLKRNKAGCPVCAKAKVSEKLRVERTYPEEHHVLRFMSTGKFQTGTKFIRTGERQGKHTIWEVECPVCSHDEYVKAEVCNGKFYAVTANLQKGKLPCRCSKSYKYTSDQLLYRLSKDFKKKGYTFVSWVGEPGTHSFIRYVCKTHGEQVGSVHSMLLQNSGCPECKGKTQQQAYINFIQDEEGKIYAAKLGIANNSNSRLKNQNYKNIHQMVRAFVYSFPTVKACKKAEKECKKLIPSMGYVDKLHMPDGHTETFDLKDLHMVKTIYENNYGTLKKEEETC